MMKNMKMKTIIMSIIAIVTAIGVAMLFILASSGSMNMMENSAEENMETYLDSQASMIENFVKNSENTLLLFSKAPEISAVLKNPGDEATVAAAQDYTVTYYNTLINWEGVYVGDWNSQVLTHPAPPVVGRVMREGERLTQLQNAMTGAESGVYDAGIIVSPASGSLILSMYAAVYDENGQPIGYVGGGIFNSELATILSQLEAKGLSGSEFYMINTETNLNYIHPNEEMVAQEVSDDMLLQVIDKVKAGETDGKFEYGNKVVEYKSIADRGWTVIIADDSDEIFATAKQNRINLVIFCALAYILIVGLAFVAVIISTKPLNSVAKAIVKLGKLDLSKDPVVASRVNNKNEIGVISREIENVRKVLTSIVITLKESTNSFANSSESMETSSNNLVEYVMNNTATTEELAASIVTTNEIISNVGEKLENINKMVDKVEGMVKSGDSQSAIILNSANSMQTTSRDSLDTSYKNVKNNRETITEVMDKLNELSEINNLVDAILGISNQTKLLSLNASIEAARAGEDGKGFAVVAQEIGNLAAKSAQTASSISDICSSTNDNIAEVSKCFDTISVYLEKDVMARFEEFNEVAKNNNEVSVELRNIMSGIKEVVGSFNKFVDEIMSQMETINTASLQNGQGVDDIVDKNEQTALVAEQISQMVITNKENSDKLEKIVNQFTNIEYEG